MFVVGGYLAFGKYSDLVDYSNQMLNQESYYLLEHGEAQLNLRATTSSPTTYTSTPTSRTTTTSRTSTKGSGKSNPFMEFIAGCFMIGFALPMVWMNERRDVKTYKVIQAARDNVREVEVDAPAEDNNFQLARASGRATTQL